MKALVVEGDRMSQCVLAKLLGERGHEVDCFENAEQAIVTCQKETYPLVFVGADLPGMNGLQFCKWLRSRPDGDTLFIMVAVSPGQPSELGQVLSSGASDFLIKPYDLGTLKMRLLVAERQMSGFFRSQELEAQMQRRDQETDTLQAELRRAGEALVKEAEGRKKLEEDLDSARAEVARLQGSFDERMQAQAAELCSKASELQNVTSFRLKVEEDLKRVREELESRTGKYTAELAAARREVGEEKQRSREQLGVLEKTCAELQARVRELTSAARDADQRRQAAETEAQRAATAFSRAQADWDLRQHEFQTQLQAVRQQAEAAAGARSAREVEAMEAERSRLQRLLAESQATNLEREERRSAEIGKLEAALQESQAARSATAEDLVKAREELAAKATSYAETATKAADEIKLIWTELLELQQQREKAATVPDDALAARAKVETELRQELERETAKRRDLEEQLQKARTQMQDRLRRMAATLEEG